ncbi:hypothetical protein PR003_g27149 [Phytophthora rubi]|uniref:Uncharacterized protein n=1 Tax=Phytophthora rubi TaxID=129364 RepID=A0A6A4C9W2_9STRA|nr:hypothetical protein PR001_g30078 [Phytophthora rubi]KAE9283349.1 hypothetical protein PR003_g27149 [Phytophthora rubi]
MAENDANVEAEMAENETGAVGEHVRLTEQQQELHSEDGQVALHSKQKHQSSIFLVELTSTCQQVMSPIGSDDTSQRPSPAHDVHDTDVQGLNVAADPFELFEGTRSDSVASEPHARGSRGSSESSERLDRLEGLLEGMAKQQAQFMANQAKLQEQLQRRSEPSHMPPYENQYGAASAFTDFIKARDRRMRVDSLDASMLSVGPTTPTLPVPTRPVEQVTNVQQPQRAPPQQPYVPSPSPEQFVPPTNFGIKLPKPRDLDWPGFGKFSGKEVYPGLGADF